MTLTTQNQIKIPHRNNWIPQFLHEFHPKLNPRPRPANTKSGAKIPQNQPNEPLERSSSDSWQHWVLMQQRYNEHIMETNRQLAVAMTLPQPEVPSLEETPWSISPLSWQ